MYGTLRKKGPPKNYLFQKINKKNIGKLGFLYLCPPWAKTFLRKTFYLLINLGKEIYEVLNFTKMRKNFVFNTCGEGPIGLGGNIYSKYLLGPPKKEKLKKINPHQSKKIFVGLTLYWKLFYLYKTRKEKKEQQFLFFVFGGKPLFWGVLW